MADTGDRQSDGGNSQSDVEDNYDERVDEEDETYEDRDDREDENDQQYSDEDEATEDDEWLPSDHPLMARPLKALTEQLERQDQELTVELAEKREQITRVKKTREQIGVDLYSFQQQLAKLQMQLEKTHDQFNTMSQLRARAESDIQTATYLQQEKSKDAEALAKRWEEAHKELEKLNVTLKQIDDFNQELSSDIKATRRVAYGAEERMQKLEKEKREQDMHIDHLEERLRETQEQLDTYQAQLEAQRGATKESVATLREAETEMEQIAAEKKDYYQRWKSSLVGMERRDQALAQAEAAIHQEQEDMLQLDTEIKGYQGAVRAEQERNQQLTDVLQRVSNETNWIEGKIAELHDTKKQLQQRYEALRRSVESCDKSIEEVRKDKFKLQSHLDSLQKRYERISGQRYKIEDQMVENASDQLTLDKGRQNVHRLVLKLRQQIHDQEVAIGEVQNELARIRVDALNTEAHNGELRKTTQEFDEELKEKDRLIQKYETEIRQRHDQIEKQQISIVRLNRKYEALTANKEPDEALGPLESTINHLKKEIDAKRRESVMKQREWISSQTKLVKLVGEMEAREEELHEQRSRKTILKQKHLRVEQVCKTLRDDIKELKHNLMLMHNGTAKLNQLIGKNREMQESLTNENFTMETEFMEKLKELEAESNKRAALLEGVKGEKESLFNQIVEVERQIMAWEKKIQLEKETQAALDPEYGQPEIRGMKKEIHRMDLRLGQLQREQEKLIHEMERTISKVESIKMKHVSSNTKTRQHMTKATLRKDIADLQGAIKSSSTEAKRLKRDVQDQQRENKELDSALTDSTDKHSELEHYREQLNNELEAAQRQAVLVRQRIILEQERKRRYEKAAQGKYKVSTSKEACLQKLELEREKTNRLTQVLQQLAAEHPKQRLIFEHLATLATPVN